MSAKCELCHKKIDFREKECDGSGFTWHSHCFRCCVCRIPLNEKCVNIRGEKHNQLYCGSHEIYQSGQQFICQFNYCPWVIVKSHRGRGESPYRKDAEEAQRRGREKPFPRKNWGWKWRTSAKV